MSGRSSASALATRLREAASSLAALIEVVDDDAWERVPAPGVWSIGKEVEHVIEAADHHQRIVRLSIGERVSSRRPALERSRLTTELSPREAVALLRERTEAGLRLLRGLTDAQLTVLTRPRRAREQRLGETIESVLIGHFDGHRAAIAAKLRGNGPRA